MKILNYSKSRENLATVIDDVVDNYETIIVTKNDKQAVIVSLDEYNSWQETNYLFKSSNNAKRLLKSIEEAEDGVLLNKELLDE